MIPNKSNFKFQELTPITGVKPYVIRFWETEFDEIAPVTSDSGQKIYTRKDIEVIFKIKKMLFEDKLTISEAKSAIKSNLINTEIDSIKINDQDFSKTRPNQTLLRDTLVSSLVLIRGIKEKNNW